MRAVQSFLSMYRPAFVRLVRLQLIRHRNNFAAYYRWFMNANDFRVFPRGSRVTVPYESLLSLLLHMYILVQLIVAVLFIVGGVQGDVTGGIYFGTALVIALPVMLAVLAPLLQFAAEFVIGLYPKTLGKQILCMLLENQAARLRQKYNFKVVVVAGSVGKTSTKLAIARTLESAGLKVRYQEGNYNDRLTVPLVLFGRELPGLFNVPAWFKILAANNRVIRQRYNYDVAVLEIGTDAPGQISQFAYLKPELAVVTSVAPEHMEYFGSLDAVAEEELSVFNFAKHVLINADDVPEAYLKRKKFFSYSVIDREAEYYATGKNEDLWGQIIEIYTDGRSLMRQKTAFIGSQGRKIVLAAAAVADILKASRQDVSNAIALTKPFAGRMQQLRGIKGSTILDDSYNATPSSVEAALAVLQHARAGMRIAILGSMNELGDFSAEAHKAVGASIDPQKISLVVTIGEAANNYLAQAALQNKCQVATFTNPKKAGEFVKRHVAKDTVVLVKGSQNGVFSEEAIKPLLASKHDAKKLVRQSKYWMHRKKRTLSL